ncbi:MAG TPA: hypothetical protein VK468_00815, partial [Pyrinomonadaceae bacterium]|nr:hypothetical protein [Pyrinomonadaceae bacterium]
MNVRIGSGGVAAVCLLFIFVIGISAQKRDKPNAEIGQMIREVSAKNIEGTIRKLVSFGTRNTLSDQNDPARGVGAARDWIFGEFQKIGAACGNCLTVEKQAFLQP